MTEKIRPDDSFHLKDDLLSPAACVGVVADHLVTHSGFVQVAVGDSQYWPNNVTYRRGDVEVLLEAGKGVHQIVHFDFVIPGAVERQVVDSAERGTSAERTSPNVTYTHIAGAVNFLDKESLNRFKGIVSNLFGDTLGHTQRSPGEHPIQSPSIIGTQLSMGRKLRSLFPNPLNLFLPRS